MNYFRGAESPSQLGIHCSELLDLYSKLNKSQSDHNLIMKTAEDATFRNRKDIVEFICINKNQFISKEFS